MRASEFHPGQYLDLGRFLRRSLRISIWYRWSNRKVESDNLWCRSAPPQTVHCLVLLSHGIARSSCSGISDHRVLRFLGKWKEQVVFVLEDLVSPPGIAGKTFLYMQPSWRAPAAAMASKRAFRSYAHRGYW